MAEFSKKNGRVALSRARRIVVKIGSSTLTAGPRTKGHSTLPNLSRLANQLSELAKTREVIIVSSGAIALGIERLGLATRPKDIPGKQACAAVGQSRLMHAWEEALDPHIVAQVLLTHADMQDRRRYLNARHALERLLAQGVIPIINENDTVSVDEIKFGDNDTLAGLVAGLVNADALIILSDVDGLYDADPRQVPTAKRLVEVREVTKAMLASAGASGSAVGTGGMATKVRAAQRVTEIGIRCVIAAGHVPAVLTRLLGSEALGTLFEPTDSTRHARTAWIAHALKPKGAVKVDAGAREAVVSKKKSLLPSGIRSVEGQFAHGDPIDLLGPDGDVFARGLAAYSADELRQIQGKKTGQIEATLGYRGLDEAVHRDDLAML